jgi:hypothetical protein
MPREGQALQWLSVDEFDGLELLEADWPIVECLRRLERAAVDLTAVDARELEGKPR